jgi:hypothetical protein
MIWDSQNGNNEADLRTDAAKSVKSHISTSLEFLSDKIKQLWRKTDYLF